MAGNHPVTTTAGNLQLGLGNLLLSLNSGGVLGALKHPPPPPPPKFYNEQARKLLEAVVQVQLHFIHMYGQCKDGKSKGNS